MAINWNSPVIRMAAAQIKPYRNARESFREAVQMAKRRPAPPMSQGDALLQGVWAAPHDHAPALVYADWLDEQGQSEMAKAVRKETATGPRAPERPSPLGPLWGRVQDTHPNPVVRAAARTYTRNGFAERGRAVARVLLTSPNPQDHAHAWLLHPEDDGREKAVYNDPHSRLRLTPLQTRFHQEAHHLEEIMAIHPHRFFSGRVVGGRFHLFDHHQPDSIGQPTLVGSAAKAVELDALLAHARTRNREYERADWEARRNGD